MRGASRVANPGCYPTAAILALAPLFKAKFVKDGPVIIDAKSGVSGAGRGGGGDFGYSDTNESVHAYKALEPRPRAGNQKRPPGRRGGEPRVRPSTASASCRT